jgi:hypothetical protein
MAYESSDLGVLDKKEVTPPGQAFCLDAPLFKHPAPARSSILLECQ